MNIDPRTLQQLLQLQMMSSLDLNGTSTDTTADSGDTTFQDLLQGLLSDAGTGSGSGTARKVIPAAEMLGRMPGAYFPQAFAAPTAYDSLIDEAGQKYGVDTSLIKAVIDAESSFNAKAVSQAGAKGLMQLMDDTARSQGVADSFDPVQNIQGGTAFLSQLLRKYNGNEGAALAAYNAGPGRIDSLGISNDAELRSKLRLLPEETQAYVDRVLGLKRQYGGL